MTAGERAQLSDALDILDRVDKRLEGFDGRLRKVEEYIVADDTRNKAASEAKESNRMNRAQIITAAGIVGSFALGLLNVLK